MNASEQKALLAILLDGDLLAAIEYVEGARKPSKPAKADADADAAPVPIPREIPTWPKFAKPAGGAILAPGIAKAISTRANHPARNPLGVAPCGCTLYPDTALMCAACIKARNADACRALIVQHGDALDAFDQRTGFTTARTTDAYRALHDKYDAQLAENDAQMLAAKAKSVEQFHIGEARKGILNRRGEALAALDARTPWRPVRTRDFMICPHNGYYGERDKHEIVAEAAA